MAEADNKDPSMDEILQSIKRIISEESDTKGGAPVEDDVLELTDMVQEDGSVVNVKAASEADLLDNIDKEMEAPAADPAPVQQASPPPEPPKEVPANVELEAIEMPYSDPEPVAESVAEPSVDDIMNTFDEKPVEDAPSVPSISEEPLVDDVVISEASAKLNALRDAVDSAVIHPQLASNPSFRSGTTVEDLVLEFLKPALKEWLDENLTTIVEGIVEREVKRITGR